MEMSLVNPMESDREKRRTRVKLTLKEFKDRTTQMLLIYKGFDITKPVKKNSRYIYFEVDGDLLNRR